MRFLHTSDWHLGRSFHQVGLLDAQSRFVDHLVETVRAENVDAVLVSGDVYDRALPSPDTVDLLSHTVTRLIDAGATVILSSGNHDSAIRLGFASDLLSRAGLHIRTSPHSIGIPVMVGGVAVYPLPYLEPAVAARPLQAVEPFHAGVLRAAMDRVDADRAVRGARSIVMAHAFVTGGATSDSERDIPWEACPPCTPGPLPGRTTPPWATCTVGSGSATAFVTAVHPWPFPSARRPIPRAPGWSTSPSQGCTSRRSTPLSSDRWLSCAATSRACSPTPHTRPPSAPGAR